jgi:hypothetical protein
MRAVRVVATVVITKAMTKKISDFATSTRPRAGQAVIVVRIMPVPYSEVITSTPRVMMQICPSIRPKSPGASSGIPVKSPLIPIEMSAPIPTTRANMMPSVHTVERTERIFVHSETMACPRWVRARGMGEA